MHFYKLPEVLRLVLNKYFAIEFMQKTNYQYVFSNVLLLLQLSLLVLISWQVTQPFDCNVNTKPSAEGYVIVN